MTDTIDTSLFQPPLTFMGVDYGHDLASVRPTPISIPWTGFP